MFARNVENPSLWARFIAPTAQNEKEQERGKLEKIKDN